MGTVPTFPIGSGLQQSDLMFLLKPPFCVAQATAPQTIVSGTWTLVTLGTATIDTDPSMWVITSPSQITINTPGRYRICAGVEYALNASGHRAVEVRKNAGGNAANGTLLHGNTVQSSNSANTSCQFAIDLPGSLAAGDVLQLFTVHTAGVNVATAQQVFGLGPAFMTVRWISPP